MQSTRESLEPTDRQFSEERGCGASPSSAENSPERSGVTCVAAVVTAAFLADDSFVPGLLL